MNERRWTLLLIALGFAVLLLEVRYLHRFVVRAYPVGWVPIVLSAACILACACAASKSRVLVKVSAAVFALSALAGLIGVYFHTGFKAKPLVELATAPLGPVGTVGPPALAPLGLTGLASIAFVVTLYSLARRD